MKKYLISSCVYMGIGLVFGVFFREFTKLNNYMGATSLGKIHLHALVLGMFFFLIVTLLEGRFALRTTKLEPWFYIFYNVGLGISLSALFLRGVFQVAGVELTNGADKAISGIAGLGHILLAIGLILFFVLLFKKQNLIIKEQDKSAQ